MADARDMGDLRALLEALRASGAADRNPVRFAYLEALTRRTEAQPEAIRRLLKARISLAANELASRPAPEPTGVIQASAVSPLADLLAYINGHAHEPIGTMPPATGTPTAIETIHPKSTNSADGHRPQDPELKSVAYFRHEWSKLSTEQQLTQTLAQAPENAGPMNSQHLVLRSLEMMRDIAPDYLQGFMSYIDTLIWLDHADPTKPSLGRGAGNESDKKQRNTKRGAPKR